MASPSPAVVAPNDKPAKVLAANPTQSASAEQQPDKPFWYRTLNDPVADFTLALVFSTVLLWRATLRLAREARESAVVQSKKMERSVVAATKSADTATKQVAISEETAYRDLRAYISVDGVEVTDVMSGSIAGNIVFKNAGQTPAAIAVYFATDINNLSLGEPQRNVPERAWQHRPFINRHGEESVYWWYPIYDPKHQAAALAKSSAEIADLVKNPLPYSFYLYGRIEFTDYMRRERVLHFSYRSAGEVKIGEPFKMVPMPTGNHYEDRSKGADHSSAPQV